MLRGHEIHSIAANMRHSAKILILILEGIINKIFYERRDYESVDELKEPILGHVRKNYEKNNSGSRGLIVLCKQ